MCVCVCVRGYMLYTHMYRVLYAYILYYIYMYMYMYKCNMGLDRMGMDRNRFAEANGGVSSFDFNFGVHEA